MRTPLRALLGVLTLITAAIVVPQPAHAAATYTAFTASGYYRNVEAVQAPNMYLGVSTYQGNVMLDLMGLGDDRFNIRFYVVPPTGSTLGVGTFTTQPNADPSSHGMRLTHANGQWCDDSGTITIHELTWSSPTEIAGFAATYSLTDTLCPGGVTGEIRWHSALGYRSISTDTSVLTWNNAWAGQQAPPQSVTFAPAGGAPVTLGAATVSGTSAGIYPITGNTCTDVTLNVGETCTITITPFPTGTYNTPAKLTLAANVALGGISVDLNIGALDPRHVYATPGNVHFGNRLVGVTSAPETVTFTAYGPLGVTFGAGTFIGGKGPFAVVTDGCSGKTLAQDETCSVSFTVKPTAIGPEGVSYRFPVNNLSQVVDARLEVYGISGEISTYHQLPPQRILDTRSGLGTPKAPIGPGGQVQLSVLGVGGVPASGVTAVVLNVTVTAPTTDGYLTVYPTGSTRPTVSSLNFAKGWTGANSVTAAVGATGKVSFFNASGNTHVIADVVGYYQADSGAADGGQYHPLNAQRVFDSREDWGVQLGGLEDFHLILDFESSANPHITAWAVNITAASPKGGGFLTAWDGKEGQRPGTSTLNFATGKTVPNMAIVPVSECDIDPECTGMPMIGIYNGALAGVDVIVDIVGYFDDGILDGGLRFQPAPPTRIADTRSGFGGAGTLGGNTIKKITPAMTVAWADTRALVMNVTAVAPSKSTYLTLWPAEVAGLPKPTVSNLNPVAGQTVANASITVIGPNRGINIYNYNGSTNVIVDVVGSFVIWPLTGGDPNALRPSAATITARSAGTAGISGVSTRR
ncbi:hypothetical protein F4553_004287 [Allocatelliglobosispora scoriae]|uniref:Choice-of-anchor D domain-containing protein n=1 Tax=Allocatelliglobosispora scoriae TaxID=643052 RepID=A0A841BTY6_9ACTN|nr:hypothetical protein [Allocatelliglobosispora scoriae]MBB5870908.1 hypothetical protein [Allocatelliglobosispora scoriae]